MMQRRYLRSNFIDTAMVLDSGAAESRLFYHTDGTGSTIALTNLRGEVVERCEYDAYGKPSLTDSSGAGILESLVGNPYLFCGRPYDVETGLYWYRLRYFDPRVGRFTTYDPIGRFGDPYNLGNPYAYVGNNPVNLLDPLGLSIVRCCRKGACVQLCYPLDPDNPFGRQVCGEETCDEICDYCFVADPLGGPDTTPYPDPTAPSGGDDDSGTTEPSDTDWQRCVDNAYKKAGDCTQDAHEELRDCIRDKRNTLLGRLTGGVALGGIGQRLIGEAAKKVWPLAIAAAVGFTVDFGVQADTCFKTAERGYNKCVRDEQRDLGNCGPRPAP